MNRASLRTLLSRQMSDVSAVDFVTAELNEALNEGVLGALKLQLSILPDSVKAISKSHIVLGQEFYEKPSDVFYLYKVQMLQADGTYKTIEKRDYDVIESRSSEAEDSVWAHFGRYAALSPIPAAGVTNGLRWLYVPTGQMTADTDIPVVHPGLHRLVFLEAALSLLPETGEPTKEIREAREREIAFAPAWLRMDVAEPELLRPMLDKGY